MNEDYGPAVSPIVDMQMDAGSHFNGTRRVDLIVTVSMVMLLRYVKSSLFVILFQVSDGLASEALDYSSHRPKKTQR